MTAETSVERLRPRTPAVATPGRESGEPPPLLVLTAAIACGAGAANLYYAQPLVGLIAPEIRLGPSAASLIVTLSQLGYAAGLLLLVPLGDILENRRIICVTMATAAVALAAAATAQTGALLLAASLLVGVSSVGVQMLVPFVAGLSPPETHGRVVGQVMSGLLLGILLARPAASLGSEFLGWRGVFAASAVLMAAIAVLLRRILPRREPNTGLRYGKLIASLWPLLRDTTALRRRTIYQSAVFASFALFWTATPLLLAGPRFHLSQTGIALFALGGAGGAAAAPLAGRLADAGWGRPGTGVAMALVAVAFALAGWAGSAGALYPLAAAALLLDFSVQGNQVIGMRTIYALGGQYRSRFNGIYIGLFFVGGAVGSALAGPALVHGGWLAVAALGVAFPVIALCVYVTEFVSRP